MIERLWRTVKYEENYLNGVQALDKLAAAFKKIFS